MEEFPRPFFLLELAVVDDFDPFVLDEQRLIDEQLGSDDFLSLSRFVLTLSPALECSLFFTDFSSSDVVLVFSLIIMSSVAVVDPKDSDIAIMLGMSSQGLSISVTLDAELVFTNPVCIFSIL